MIHVDTDDIISVLFARRTGSTFCEYRVMFKPDASHEICDKVAALIYLRNDNMSYINVNALHIVHNDARTMDYSL